MHLDRLPFSFAVASAGNSIEAKMAMIAITTSNSISVNPLRFGVSLSSTGGEEANVSTRLTSTAECPTQTESLALIPPPLFHHYTKGSIVNSIPDRGNLWFPLRHQPVVNHRPLLAHNRVCEPIGQRQRARIPNARRRRVHRFDAKPILSPCSQAWFHN